MNNDRLFLDYVKQYMPSRRKAGDLHASLIYTSKGEVFCELRLGDSFQLIWPRNFDNPRYKSAEDYVKDFMEKIKI